MDIPEFDGKLRAHIVAYNNDAIGSVEDTLIVRNPVVANLSTPRFLAPSDIARLDLVLHNIDNESEKYNLKVESMTDIFRCRKCGNRKCIYYEVQTRSADEPMTQFITCLTCNNRWKQ